MRSLSLESILVNKNMKLLILLVTLLVQTNSSLSKPTTSLKMIFTEILYQLKDLKEELNPHDLKAFNRSVQVQIPHDIKNVCECEAAFVQHLKAALMSVKKVLRMDETEAPMEIIHNILDYLNKFDPTTLKKSSDSCTFKEHTIRHIELLITKNTGFIQNWNSHCALKRN